MKLLSEREQREMQNSLDLLHKEIKRLKTEKEELTEQVLKLNLGVVTNPVKIIDWKHTEKEMPIAYKTGVWDGKNSDQVVCEDKSGKQYLAHYCEGFMDGSKFADWYENNDFLITEEIVRWLPIPL